VNVAPAKVTVASLGDWAVFSAIAKVTVPLPEPFVPDAMLIQFTPELALQEHPEAVATSTLTEFAPLLTEAEPRLSE
jgi:hypothetical protein